MRFDLLEQFPYTAGGSEVDELDLASPEAEAHLLRGWARGEQIGSGEPGAIALPPRSDLWWTLSEPAERRLTLRCVRIGGRPPATAPLVVRMNGRRIGVVSVDRGLAPIEVRVPAGVQRRGTNVLTLEHRGQPRDPAAPPRPSLGQLGCTSIRLLAVGEEPGPRPRLVAGNAPGAALQIPGGGRVEYVVRVPAGSALRLAVAPDTGEGEARLRVAVSPEGDPRTAQYEVAGASGAPRERTLALDAPSGRLARLVLENPGSEPVRVVRAQLLEAAARPEAPTAPAPPRRPNVLLYLIDTLRADHLGCYGYDKATSPHLDALAKEAVVFERAVAQASWTRPATASILTGLLPPAHGATQLTTGIHPEVPMLAERLQQAGYRTGGFVSNVVVSEPWGFARGFETFEYLPEDPERPTIMATSSELNARVIPWLAVRDERPFFLYVHATDPHAPYLPPDAPATEERLRRFTPATGGATAEDVPALVELYDGEIAANDRSLGALLDELRRRGLYEDTIVLVTSDHGEEFQDHGRFGHGHTLFEELIRVPLLLRLPGGRLAGTRDRSLAQQVDLVPTILELAGLPGPQSLPGSALVRRDAGGGFAARAADREIEALSHTQLYRELVSVSSVDWKLVQESPTLRAARLYALSSDPKERRDASSERPLLRAYSEHVLRAQLARVWRSARPGMPEPRPLDAETRDRLRALGYVVEDSGDS